MDFLKVQVQVRALVEAVIGDREDAALVGPVLRVQLQTAIADFRRYHDPRLAATRVRDRNILTAWYTAQKGK